MKNFRLLSLLAALVYFCFCGCGGNGSSDAHGNFRILNAFALASAIDLYIDDELEVASLPFAESSGYFKINEGDKSLLVNEAGQFVELVRREISLDGDFDYTFVVFDRTSGGTQNADSVLFNDNNNPPEDNRAKIRIINGSRTAQAIDVYITSTDVSVTSLTPSINRLTYRAASSYLQNAPGTFRVLVTKGNKTDVIGSLGSFSIADGEIRTILVTDSPGGGFPALLSDISDRE